MRVVMVLQSFAPIIGGAQEQVRRLAPLLERRGVEVVVVTRRPEAVPAREAIAGATVMRVSTGWGGPRAALRFVAGTFDATRRLRPAVVHVHDLLSPATAGVLVRRALGVPLVAKVASSGPGGDLALLRERPGGALRVGAVVRATDAFACLTDEVERELAAAGARRAQLRRLPNGVDTNTFRPARDRGEARRVRARLGLPASEPLALFAGRLRSVKRLDVAVAACRSAGVRLVVAGDGPLEAELRADPAVTVLGPVDDIAALHRCVDVYVSASRTEGMSGSMLEALASGVPVAAVPAGGVRELLGGGAGVIARDGGAVALAEAIEDARKLRHAELGRSAAQALGLAAAADRLVELYAELAAQPRPKIAGRSTSARSTPVSAGTHMRRVS